MTTISQYRKRLGITRITEIASESLEDAANIVTDAQRDQLRHGLRKDGSLIGQYKSPVYAAKKYAQNPLAGFGNVDLILTGDYSNNIFLDVRGVVFVLESADNKAADIFKKYGDALGLGYQARIKLISGGLKQIFISNYKKG